MNEGLRELREQFLQLARHVPSRLQLCAGDSVLYPTGLVIEMRSAAPRMRAGRTMLTRAIRSLFAPYDPRGLILEQRPDGTYVFDWVVEREVWDGYARFLDSVIESNLIGTCQYMWGLARHDADIIIELRRELPVGRATDTG